MRYLVYAAGAYAMCMGTTEAFAPQSAVGGLAGAGTCSGRGCNTGERAPALKMSMDSSERWSAPTGYVPNRASRPEQVDAIIGGHSAMSAAASFEASYKAPSASDAWKPPPAGYTPGGRAAPTEAAANSMAKTWSPPSGYTPSSRPAQDTAAVMSRVSEMLGSQPTQAPTSRSWAPPTGYVPGGAAASAPRDSLSSAPTKKFQPCKHILLASVPRYADATHKKQLKTWWIQFC